MGLDDQAARCADGVAAEVGPGDDARRAIAKGVESLENSFPGRGDGDVMARRDGAEDGGGRILQGGVDRRQELRRIAVVVVQNGNPPTARLLDAPVQRVAVAHVGGLAQIGDARVRVLRDHVRCVIRGRVVYHHDLKVLEALCQDAVEREDEQIGPSAGGDDDSEKR